MKLTLFAVCAISAVAIRLPQEAEPAPFDSFPGQVQRIFNYTDKSKDGILSEKELISSLKKGIDGGAVPEEAVPVMKQAVQDNATNKDDPNAPAVVCNLDCLQASFDQTLK